ncbi:MAG: M20/M25/M40 family metallo-hydrolase, partial [Clostridia bacterium]|nr:M20/M25/M40 family metallo-hydrolase [Clostridia bacterium]
APLYNNKQSFLIKTLLNVYNEVTGKNAQPVAIGGGTYARALKYGAAFGPEEAGEECTIHQANEYITFEKIEKCYKIYTLAIERLTK